MTLLEKIQHDPQSITFQEVIAHIDSIYEFTPTRFSNGNTVNESGQNNGSCKIFFFSLLLSLTQDQTLELFGDYYRVDVLGNPDGTDHQNIRNFMKTGLGGIQFDSQALKERLNQS